MWRNTTIRLCFQTIVVSPMLYLISQYYSSPLPFSFTKLSLQTYYSLVASNLSVYKQVHVKKKTHMDAHTQQMIFHSTSWRKPKNQGGDFSVVFLPYMSFSYMNLYSCSQHSSFSSRKHLFLYLYPGIPTPQYLAPLTYFFIN